MSPEAELTMLLGGSAFLHHFQHKMGANPETNSGGIFGGLGNIMSMFGGGGGKKGSPPPAVPSPPETTGSFTQRPTMRRPNAPSFSAPPPPPVQPTHTPDTTAENNALREELAVLQGQMRQQGGSFVVMSQGVPRRHSGGPQIEELE